MALAALLPLTDLIQLSLIGTLYLHDLVAPVVLLLLLLTRDPAHTLGPARVALWMVGIWLLGAIATDLYRGTPPGDLARGWSRIILFGVNIAMLWLLSLGSLRTLACYVFTFGLCLGLNGYVHPSEFFDYDPWKFGVGMSLAIMVASISSLSIVQRLGGKYLPAAMIGVIGLISLWLNSRSLFAICFVAAGYAALAAWVSTRPAIQRRTTKTSFIAVLLLGLLFSQVLTAAYETAADSGWLGEVARKKYLEQTAVDSNIFLGGRPEFPVTIQAIKDSPLLGHGSWAQDAYYTKLFYDQMVKMRLVTQNFYQIGEDVDFRIPSHSHILGAWMEAGILGSVVWFWALLLVFQALYAILKRGELPNAIVTLIGVQMLWDIPFSPFGADARIFKAIEICVMLAATEALRRSSTLRVTDRTPRPALPAVPTERRTTLYFPKR